MIVGRRRDRGRRVPQAGALAGPARADARARGAASWPRRTSTSTAASASANTGPASTVDLRDHYQLGIGELVVDLRDTDLPKGDVPLDLDVGIGEARVIVPDDVCVATDADVGLGNVHVLGRDHGGVDVDYEDAPDAQPTATRLLVHGDVGVGRAARARQPATSSTSATTTAVRPDAGASRRPRDRPRA